MLRSLALSLALCAPLLAPGAPLAAAEPWNQFRGPRGEGRADAAQLPLEFGESQNVRWKTAVPGKAWSSPVVWGNQVWMTNAPEDGKELRAVCLDLNDGKVLHDLLVFDNPNPQYCHSLNSYASCTPFVEEGRVYVHFGAHGTACLDTQTGKTLWSRRDLECNHFRGPASSPMVYGDMLVLQFDGYDLQYVIALDKQTGNTLWKRDRAFEYRVKDGDAKKAYGTPVLIEHAGRKQLVCPAAVATEAFDPKSGELLWTVRHGGMNASARPLFADNLLFITNGMGAMVAVKPEGQGDISANIAWQATKGIAKRASPLLIDGLLYMVADTGVASCLDAKTGAVVWSERLKGGEYAASPVFASGRIYFFSMEGYAPVVAAGREFKLLAENQFDAGFMATPAIVGNALIARTKTHVYRLETAGAE